jgi:hypothetical protein
VADFLGREITGTGFGLTTDREFYTNSPEGKINYSPERVLQDELWIQPHALLFESSITAQHIVCFEVNGQKAFFKTEGDLPFDIFAACFFLLSRYEEYLPHEKDIYGRFAHEQSLACREGFLHQPLVNRWMQDLKNALETKGQRFSHRSTFTFLPTYDIDIAWSYKHKGWRRSLGGFMQSLLKGNWQQARERIQVGLNKQKDPFDCYDWLHQLHERYRLKPYYFFLLAGKRGKYDKNISPRKKALQELVHHHFLHYPAGIHPSWRSGGEHGLLKEEIETLGAFTGNPVLASRQHYIRFSLPGTFRMLLDNGIRCDFSMGYGSINGFRASTASPFYWYDLVKDEPTSLLLFPFCFMEANSFYEQKFTAEQALDEMRKYYQEVRSVDGTLVMIWHNHFLGTDKLFPGWKEAYETFIKEVASSYID